MKFFSFLSDAFFVPTLDGAFLMAHLRHFFNPCGQHPASVFIRPSLEDSAVVVGPEYCIKIAIL